MASVLRNDLKSATVFGLSESVGGSAVLNVATHSAQKAAEGLLLVSSSSDIHGSILSDTIVQKNLTLHVVGNLLGSLTIEPGAKVVVAGSVDGKNINRAGMLVVH